MCFLQARFSLSKCLAFVCIIKQTLVIFSHLHSKNGGIEQTNVALLSYMKRIIVHAIYFVLKQIPLLCPLFGRNNNHLLYNERNYDPIPCVQR